MFRRVAIIGGGAAAVALLSELVERAHAPLHLDWYTGGVARPGRGTAYGTSSPRHLLNVRAATMGMFSRRPHGFLDFAQRADPQAAGTDFLPRRLYGDYLEDEATRALAQSRSRGVDVRMVPFAADALVPETDGATVIQGERASRVDAAVLALGALPVRPLAGVDATVLGDGRYVIDPWSLLAGATSDDAAREVALVGLGLTAVDVLLELAERWPHAHFTAVSRHGRLPASHLPASAVPDDDGGALVEAMHDAPETRRWLRLLREAIDASDDWRVVIDSLRPYTPELWDALPAPERARFLRHARWAWERARHRMPPQVERQVQALERDGRLQRVSGRVTGAGAAQQRVQLSVCRAGHCAPLVADLAIQTIGLDTDVRGTAHPLMRQLVTNGHVTPDPFGLGCQATLDGHLCRDGVPWPSLYGVGSLLRGARWESVAMPEIRLQARMLAKRLLDATGPSARRRLASQAG
ncbi:FAD/NAD(P)-binding protein [Frateuria hangzhouensis]|uniref:FAD/NAD(P)-binding protein n=1 Tax=Frateuria hangzhouensis TaxID=2995589 RepID=UPI002261017A|nr:FAD/NAD(P)-binding protein [Frateuria sp. STR12]MCX7514623.1 FAD/NAD(P)-binding protein [Frateuria sp. STR12]